MYCVGMPGERRKSLTLLALARYQGFDFDATTNFNIFGFYTAPLVKT